MAGFTNMIGTEGLVAKRLKPDGYIKIDGELWAASAANGQIESGTPVVVTGQQGLKLVVQVRDQQD
jgi:membrane-bound ClpP family serine protease